MNNIVDTKEEALRHVENSDLTEMTKFCPLIKKQCMDRCASFNHGGLLRLGDIKRYCKPGDEDKYQWWPASCMNMIVTGALQVDNSC